MHRKRRTYFFITKTSYEHKIDTIRFWIEFRFIISTLIFFTNISFNPIKIEGVGGGSRILKTAYTI